MSAKHTPGPWRAEFGNNRARVLAGIEHEIAEVPTLRSTNAEVDGNRDVMIANARLVAEAPALLEALRVCAAAIKHAGDVPTADETMDLAVALASARAAIAKAEGA